MPVLLCVVAAGCEAPIASPEDTPPSGDPVADHDGPALDTDPITAPQTLDQPIVIDARATDSSGVYTVILHFKPQNTDWQTLRMTAVSADGSYQAQLTREMLNGASSLSYYLEAADGTPYHNATYSPSTGAESPYRFNLVY
jgi:hypothetical protein